MYFVFDTIRIFSVIWVVAFHSQLIYVNDHILSENFFNFLISKGNLGVDIFFFLSGFLVLASLDIHKDGLYKYFLRRFFRIFPLYFLLSILFVIVSFLIGKNNYNFYYFVSSILFISSISGYPNPILYVGWSLEYEMVFYLLNSILIFSGTLLKPLIIFKGFLFFVSIFLPVYLGFFLGVYVFIFHKHYKEFFWRYKIIYIFLLLVVFFIHFILHKNIEQLFCLFLFGSLVIFTTKLTIPRSRISVLLSNSTYAIYLIQVFTISGFYKILKIFDEINFTFFIAATLILTIFAGLICHLVVEIFLINKIKKKFIG
jgi:peptidoglycan/LPS O-acetylase OafA/YrhL